jgi:dTDP-4-dehydrorhamnose reductase
MKIVIIGANGQLGTDLMEALSPGNKVTGLSHHDIEITDINNIQSVLNTLKPDIVLNTAAYHVVPEAESFPDKAFSINGAGTLNLAKVCTNVNARLVHYSTDYVFDGKKQKPYTESDLPNPLNVYATTKLAGEHFALNYCEQCYVVRVSGIYGKVPSRVKGGNFVTTMIRLAQEKPEVRVVDDEILTPTPTAAIARNTASLIQTDQFGLYHMSCEGECSWYEFAKVIWDTLGLQTPLFRAKVKDFPMLVKRPVYSVLENSNLKTNGINEMPEWKEALVQFLQKNFNPSIV